MKVRLGIERFLAHPPKWASGARLGLVCNQASVDGRFRHAATLVRERFGGQLKCLFSPQHGLWGEKQDNMVESADCHDAASGLPVFSLYGKRRRPTAAQFALADWILLDLQDVGCRVYTFASTMACLMEEAAKAGVGIAVLDRPNPIGGVVVEGPLLKDDCRSFVGVAPIPMRHGLTMGELARFIKDCQGLRDLRLEVVTMAGWRRHMHWPECGLGWAMPSPNMPTFDTALVYPGQVALEGTNLSEGRGTTRPFELCGAPYINPFLLAERLGTHGLPGVVFRPLYFEPTFHKWSGQSCGGLDIRPVNPKTFRSFTTTLALLREVLALWPKDFAWRQPPYEYETERLPIDVILGDTALRAGLEAGSPLEQIESSWRRELQSFLRRRRACLLY
ncbi:MAG: DUF1343 domain-containing protein [Pseudomonadota bacterium]